MIENLFFVDLETTGFSHKRHAIIQIGGILEMHEKEVDRFELEVAPFPTDEIDDEALAVNKYTKEEIKNFQTPEKIHAQIKLFLHHHNPDDFFRPVAYNAPFDERFLKAWFGKCGDNYDAVFYSPAIDVLEMARTAMPRLKDHKMMTVAQALEIDFKEEDAHDAMNDVEVVRKIYKRLKGGM